MADCRSASVARQRISARRLDVAYKAVKMVNCDGKTRVGLGPGGGG